MNWISVKDKMPQPGIHVLVFYQQQEYGHKDHSLMTIAYHFDNGTWDLLGDSDTGLCLDCNQTMYDFFPSKITHWIPLPNPPK